MAHRSSVWVPNQHGAWAMLAVPLITGSVLRSPPDAVQSLLLSGCFTLGYFGFFATSRWLKSPPRRRGRHLPPLLTYTSVSAVLGVLALARTGAALLGWIPVFAALLVPALWLARQRNERALIGGALTTAAACLMTLVLTHDSPAAVFTEWPAARTATIISLALFGYFFGTVLHVKSLIRERGNARIAAAALAWHLAWAITTLPIWGFTASWAWTALFALATVRTAVLGQRARTKPVRPAVIGVIEVCMSLLALACALAVGAPV